MYYRPQTSLICLENTVNMAGGTVYQTSLVDEICDRAHDAGIHVHLDGAQGFQCGDVSRARTWREMTRKFDSVQFCLSKGLGAPVGSMIVGSRDFVERCRPIRKMLGGGMRQAGVLAAAGLVALEEGPKRLQEDHDNAQVLAQRLARVPGIALDPAKVHTNIVIFSVGPSGLSSSEFLTQMAVARRAGRACRRAIACGWSHISTWPGATLRTRSISSRRCSAAPCNIPGMRCAGLMVALIVAVFGGSRPSAQTGELALILSGLADADAAGTTTGSSASSAPKPSTSRICDINLKPTGRPRTTVFELSVARDPQPRGEALSASIGRCKLLTAARRGRISSRVAPIRRRALPSRWHFCSRPITIAIDSRSWTIARAVLPARVRWTSSKAAPARVRIKWEGSCFEAEGGGHEGRVWFDPISYDVLQVTLRLSKPFLVPMRIGYVGLDPAIRVERSEMTIRFSRVEFQQPDEVVLLPESIDTLTVFRGALSLKTSQKLSNFRRFLTESRLEPHRIRERFKAGRSFALVSARCSMCIES